MQTFVNQPPTVLGYGAPFPKIGLEILAKEPCLFSCSEEAVNISGGVLAKTALKHIQAAYKQDIQHAKTAGLSPVIDVRVQRLMPEMYPSIPGWHCDAVPRDTYIGQPNFAAISPAAFHVAVLLSNEPAGVSNTEFVIDRIKPKLFDKERIYRDLHGFVETHKPQIMIAEDGEFVYFTPRTIHRAKPAQRRGWRMFMRYSMYHKPPLANGINSTQHIYIVSEKSGW